MKKRKKIGICGNYSKSTKALGGQSIKTRLITDALIDEYGNDDVYIADTSMGRIQLIKQCLKIARKCDNIIIIVARNGVKVLIPLFAMLSNIFKNTTHYVIVGAWICEVIDASFCLRKTIGKINHIYPQTRVLADKLINQYGLDNIQVMYNFKNLKSLKSEEIKRHSDKEFKVCCVSRVEPMKGIQDAIEVVAKVNTQHRDISVLLDIYGPIRDDYKKEIIGLIDKYDFVKYCGIIQPNETVCYIKEYYLLLFPTRYYTEGIPGTVVDAYFSGVPVLSARWESCTEVIKEGETGISYSFGDIEDFYNKFVYLLQNEDIVYSMKSACINVAKEYTQQEALKVLLNNLI